MTRIIEHDDYQPAISKPSGKAIAVAGNLLIVSLPLLFWSQAVTINSVAVLLSSCLMCSLELRAKPKASEVLHRFGRYQKLAMTGGILLLLLQWCCLAESLNRSYDNSIAVICGLLITMIGCALRIRGIENLQTAFCSDLTNSTLTTTGIHSAIRHPSETGLLLACTGLTVIAGGLCSAVAILPACWCVAQLRIAEEERWLHLQHGEAYTTYCSHTGQWLPILWHHSDAAASSGEPSI